MVGAIAELLEAPPIDLRARGFRRITRARLPRDAQAWDRRVSEDVVWRISIDGDRYSAIQASVVVPFLAGCRPFAPFYVPFHDSLSLLSEDVTTALGRGIIRIAMFDIDRPRRRRLPHIPQTAPEQLAWLIDEHAMPFLERFRDLDAVLAALEANAENDRDARWAYFRFCETAMLKWRRGDLDGAESDLAAADASITPCVPRLRSTWPPRSWFGLTPQQAADDQKGWDDLDAEQKAFVRDVRHFVRHRDPSQPVVPVPLWPGLEDVGRTWRGGTWRRRFPKTPWKVPTLHVNVHDEDVVGVLFGPTDAGQGEAWLGPGPAYFEDGAVYDVDQAVDGLCEWALRATGTAVDREALRALISPAHGRDLLEALTSFCALLGLGLPKT